MRSEKIDVYGPVESGAPCPIPRGYAPLITILIRTMPGREAQLSECLNSLTAQTYKNWNMISHKDNREHSMKQPFDYNLICNDLKRDITDGWFFFLDDDDYLNAPDSLEQIAMELTNPNEAVLCQFLRAGVRLKPSGGDMRNKFIRSGQVGLPCIVLHHSQKHIADVQALDNGDFLYIEAISKKIPIKFVEKILVNSPKRSYGK